MLNQIRAGLPLSQEDIFQKPQELILYEECREFGLPIWPGGLVDQPYLWLEMYQKIKQTLKLFQAQKEQVHDQGDGRG